MVSQYIEVWQSYGNPNTLKCFNILKCFNLMKVTIGLQHFNILGYHRIAILQYIANYLFLQRTLTASEAEGNADHVTLLRLLPFSDGSFASPLELVALAQHVFYSVEDYRMAATTMIMQARLTVIGKGSSY